MKEVIEIFNDIVSETNDEFDIIDYINSIPYEERLKQYVDYKDSNGFNSMDVKN